VIDLAGRVAQAREALLAAGIPADEAAGDAEVLARHALQWDLTQYTLGRRQPPPLDFQEHFDRLIARRLTREPVSQIVGHREFWGLEFEVTRDVLTPRPETELIVQAARNDARRREPRSIVDVGTGSGCLAIALALEFPQAELIATDLSHKALAVARRNALRHGVNNRIAFYLTDLLPPVPQIDLVVSNPPYVSRRDAATLPPEVREYEPELALFAGGEGLDVYRRLLPEARYEIADEGRLILEVGIDQARTVAELAVRTGWEVEHIHRDLQGIERTLTLKPSASCDQVAHYANR
jgi:release factor glutamine methyltransferase